MISLKEFVKKSDTFIVAHRGASCDARENTMRAFKKAISDGAHMLECDVQVTKDKQIIVYHDFFLPNSMEPISEMLYKDIIARSVGINEESIPLLKDLFELVKDRIYLMIELKITDKEGFEDTIDAVASLVKEYKFEQYSLIGSFNTYVLKYLRDKYPEIYLAAIQIPGSGTLPSEIAQQFNYEVFICSIDELSKNVEEDAKQTKIYLGVYSVDNEEQYKFAKKYNIIAYASNKPKELKEIMSNK